MSHGWESSVQRILGRDISVGPHGMSVFLPCKGGCETTIQFRTQKVMSPEGLRRKLETEGWRLGPRRHCPQCNAAKPQPKENKSVPDKPMLAAVPTPPAPLAALPAMSPTDAARAMRRAVLQWLDEAYDVGKSIYRAGVTDESIAKETGAAVALVKQLREENYGPLSLPPELAEVMEELAGIKRDLLATREKFDSAMSAITGRAMAAEQKLSRIASKNGWPL